MLTPIDIENKVFSKKIRGYDQVEVDEFLDEIIIDMEELLAELSRLKSENESLREENAGHRESQKSVMNTLDSAKKLMKDISESAEKRADIIIRNAKLDAQMIIKDAEGSVTRYGGEGTELKEKIMHFRGRYKKLLEEELASIDEKGSDLLEDLEKEFMPASLLDDVEIPESVSDDTFPRTDEDLIFSDMQGKNSKSYLPKETVVINKEGIDKIIGSQGK